MTVLDSPPTGRPPTRRRWGTIAGAILAALVLLAGLTWVAFTSLYSPIKPNGSGAYLGAMKPVKEWGPRSWEQRSVGLAGPADGTGELLIGIRNDGPLPIRLLGDGYRDKVDKSVVTVLWGTDISMGGAFPKGRAFPVTMRPGDELALVIKVTKRGCYYDKGAAGGPIIATVPLRWSVLSRERTHRLDAEKPDTGMTQIYVCPLPTDFSD